MGFQGQLSSVSLTDIFQTLSMNRQTGTLTASSPSGSVHIWFDGGVIMRCTAQPIEDRPLLIHALFHKSLLTADQADSLSGQFAQKRSSIREILQASAMVADADLDDITIWCAEESICPIFEWKQGDFAFIDGGPTQEVMALDSLELPVGGLATPQLVLEATRREDEWKRIREVIPDAKAYYIVDDDGRSNIKNIESDPEVLKVLRLMDGRHSLENISSSVGVSRFDAFAIAAQLVLGGVARPRSPQELVDDAVALRSQGDIDTAKELLEQTLGNYNVPEVQRPLAEICIETGQMPRAVELYLELIQRSQDAGELEQALIDLDTIITLSPADPDLHYDRAQTLGELGRMEDAATAYVQAAQQYLASRKIEQASDACHRAKNLQPRAADPHRYLAKAYLMEGHTENAIVEYKSLWHALLSSERPRKALESLNKILDSDCKFQTVKDQVLAHAQSSDAVKTGNAVRILVYAIVVVVLLASVFMGWKILEKEVFKAGGDQDLTGIRQRMSGEMSQLRHAELINELQGLARGFSHHPELLAAIEQSINEVKADAESRAVGEIASATTLTEGGKLEDAEAILRGVLQHFPESQAAIQAKQELIKVSQAREQRRWQETLTAIDRTWQSESWDAALTEAKKVIEAGGLPDPVQIELNKMVTKFTTSLASSQELYRRAERLENLGRKADALAGYRRAKAADGETFRARANEKLIQIERQFADELGARMSNAFKDRDDLVAFSALEDLKALAKTAATDEPGKFLAALRLPFLVNIDSRFAELALRRKGKAVEIINPPANTSGPWSQVVTYGVNEELVAEVRRPGFTTLAFNIAAIGKSSGTVVQLKRGPLWQTDLNAVPTTRPIATGKFILLGTSRSTLEIIDAGLGTSRSVGFPDSVSQVSSVPFVYKNRVYLILDDRLRCIELDTSFTAWTWPSDAVTDHAQLQENTLWVQEHELNRDKLQIFLGTISGRLLCLGADEKGAVAWPSDPKESGVSAPPLVARLGNNSTLYVPSGSRIVAYDAPSVSATSPPKRLFDVETRGDIIGRPVRAMVAGKPAILVNDSSGVVVALDADVLSGKRTLGSWSVEGSPSASPVIHPAKPIAYVGVTEGRLLFLDLAAPGRLLKRFPPQGTLGQLPGAPVVGLNGVYLADANGILYCIHPESGAELWRTDLGSQVSTGILAVDGRIYVPTHGGSLLCYEEGDLD